MIPIVIPTLAEIREQVSRESYLLVVAAVVETAHVFANNGDVAPADVIADLMTARDDDTLDDEIRARIAAAYARVQRLN